MISYKTPPVLAILLAIVPMFSSAQNAQETIILYNSQPISVELSDVGKILNFYGLMPGYMSGYDLGVPSLPAADVVVDEIDPTFTNESTNAEYNILSTERFTLEFMSGYATLSSANINTLNNIAAQIRSGVRTKVLITVYKSSNDNSTLIENRLNSTLTYLSIKGISESQIMTEIRESEALSDAITVNYLD